MSRHIVIANWKMNPVTPADAKRIFTGIQKKLPHTKDVQVVVCPPAIFLPVVANVRAGTRIALGAQDTFYEESGAHTGETSPAMIRAHKATWTIVGHSERRALGESNELVGRKVYHAIQEGLMTVLCVGERERAEDGSYYRFVQEEVEAGIAGLQRKDVARLVIAYEPVWAIGKRAEEAMQPEELLEMVLFIRKLLTERFGRAPALRVPILYGGAVKPENAVAIIKEGGVSGLLVGSASLEPKAFTDIITRVTNISHTSA